MKALRRRSVTGWVVELFPLLDTNPLSMSLGKNGGRGGNSLGKGSFFREFEHFKAHLVFN